jgi:hypothetical protein
MITPIRSETMSTKNGNQVLVALKTPLMPQATTLLLSGRLTLAESFQALRQIPPKDANATRVLQQLERETSGPHDFLALTRTGEIEKVDPRKVTLEEIAIPREVRTAHGIEKIPTAAYEVQAYTPVGIRA